MGWFGDDVFVVLSCVLMVGKGKDLLIGLDGVVFCGSLVVLFEVMIILGDLSFCGILLMDFLMFVMIDCLLIFGSFWNELVFINLGLGW